MASLGSADTQNSSSLYARVAALEAENARLREVIADRAVTFPEAWRLTRYETRLVADLARHRRRYHSDLVETLYWDDPNGGPLNAGNSVSVLLCSARAKLAAQGIALPKAKPHRPIEMSDDVRRTLIQAMEPS